VGIRELRRQRVVDWKTLNQCASCGEADIDCLDAHHAEGSTKEFSVAHISGRTLDAIDCELQKCVSLCCRCHRKFNSWLRTTGLSASKDNFETWLSVQDAASKVWK
jgi:hypothetical protein